MPGRYLTIILAAGPIACSTSLEPLTGPDPLPGAPAAGQIAEIAPGGDTICARGAAYRFFARGGDPKRLVIDFQGGGACWNPGTCAAGASVYFQEATTGQGFAQMVAGEPLWGGYYELENSDNPFAGWTFVHLPYCTGDIHWGDATVTYDDELTVHHRGLSNARAALSWVADHYDPEVVLVAGFSAGSYGAIGHSAFIAEQYPEARIAVVGDSGSGVITDSFFAESFPNWNVEAVVPRHVAGLEDQDPTELTMIDLYRAIAGHYRDRGIRYAQYSSAYDQDQTTYYALMGGQAEDWAPKLRASFEAIRAGADNFRYYLAEGPVHGGTVFEAFYLRSTAGRPYTAWLDQLVNESSLPDDVACVGEGCLDDPLCAACNSGAVDDAATCFWCLDWTQEDDG